MIPPPSTLSRAALWAFLAALAATTLWTLLTATLAPLLSGEGPGAMAGSWRPRVIGAVYVGGFVAAVVLLPHVLLFAAWLATIRRFPRLEGTRTRLAATSLGLALPFVLVVFGSYAAPTGPLGPFWSEAFAALPWVLVSTWGGIFLPRLLARTLRFSADSVAA